MSDTSTTTLVDELELKRRLNKLASASARSTIANHRPVTQEVLAQLTQYIIEANVFELYQLNPRYFAHKLGHTPYAALELLVRMVEAGVFTLNWEVRCPSCQQIVHGYHHLAETQSVETCTYCGSFPTRLDYEVCISFTVNSRIRQLPESITDDSRTFLGQVHERHGAVSGSDLLGVQFFRDFFDGEAVPINQSLKVERMSFVFTDLLGSTALYARQGDPRAFKLVSDHYTILFDDVNRHHGAVIKTVGDAVMASFGHPYDALAAAASFQRSLAAFNQRTRLNEEDALILKVGIHTGSCLAVNLNNRLDYFGTTVNIASRIEELAIGGQILVSDATLVESSSAGISDMLEKIGCRETRNFSAELRGVSEALTLHELMVLPDS